MENLENLLNEAQLRAVRCTEGPLLVLAGAGSGKTRVLTYRIAYLIGQCGVAPWNVLAITFTNKAAGEMRERVDQLVGAAASSVWVSTFHSMCLRILRRHIEAIGYNRDFSIYDTDDQRTVMRQIFKDRQIDPKIYKERTVLSAISDAKNNAISPAEYRQGVGNDLNSKRIADCYEEYEKRLRLNNALDFDDLLLKTVELLECSGEVLEYYQNRFRYILVDEYQDTNDVQFKLVKLLSDKYKNICVVGDDDQSIYRFRGANIENILSFEKTYPRAQVVKLEQNYRSTSKILDTANAVIAHNAGRKQKRLWTEKQGGADVLFQEYENAKDEAAAVVRMVKDCGRAFQDQAVLYRTNAQSRLLEEQCIRMNVPYRLVGGVNFYQRKEIKDILAYMKLVANPDDDVAFERVINVPKRGIGPGTITKLREFSLAHSLEGEALGLYDAALLLQGEGEIPSAPGIPGKAGKELSAFLRLVERWKAQLPEAAAPSPAPSSGAASSEVAALSLSDETAVLSLSDLIRSIRDETGYADSLKAEGEVEAESRLSNIEELISKAADYEGGSEHPSLSEFLEEISLLSDLDRQDGEKDVLTLMTLHGAKGLEFPKVYMVGMSDGLFPGFMSMDNPEDLEEERRLCYVGITRAQEELFLSSARSRMVNGQYQRFRLSRFVEEMPDELVLKKGLSGRLGGLEDFFSQEEEGVSGGAYRGSSGGNYYGDRYQGQDRRFGSGSAGRGYGANSYGLSGMGSTVYLDRQQERRRQQQENPGRALSEKSRNASAGRSPKRAGKARGSGIPSSYVQKGADLLKPATLAYSAGDRVSHVKFGAGTVKEIQDDKKDFMVTVDFDTAGTKRMLAAFAKLTPLQE